MAQKAISNANLELALQENNKKIFEKIDNEIIQCSSLELQNTYPNGALKLLEIDGNSVQKTVKQINLLNLQSFETYDGAYVKVERTAGNGLYLSKTPVADWDEVKLEDITDKLIVGNTYSVILLWADEIPSGEGRVDLEIRVTYTEEYRKEHGSYGATLGMGNFFTFKFEEHYEKVSLFLDFYGTTPTPYPFTLDNIVYPMVIPGSMYVNKNIDFCGEMPSPNPKYKKEVRNVSDCPTLLPRTIVEYNYGTQTSYAYTVCSEDFIPCKPGDAIKICCNHTDILGFGVCWYNNEKFIGANNNDSYTSIYNISAPENANQFKFNVAFKTRIDTIEDVKKVTLTINNMYVTLIETTGKNGEKCNICIHTKEPIRKNDKIIKINKEWAVKRTRTKVILDGKRAIAFNDITNGFARCSTDLPNGAVINSLEQIMSDSFIFTLETYENKWSNPTAESGYVGISTTPGRIGFTLENINSLEELKTWLANNLPEFEYELAEPVYEVLNLDAQIALNSLKTFSNTTNIRLKSVIEQENILLEYGTTKKSNYILENLLNSETSLVINKDVNERLNELEIALLASGGE